MNRPETTSPTEPAETTTEAASEASTGVPTEAPTDAPRVSLAQAILNESGTLTLLYGPEYHKGERYNGETIADIWFGNEITEMETFPGWFEKVCKKYVIDANFAEITPSNMAHWFEGCPEDGLVGLENLNTARVEDMYNMFSYTGLKKLDLRTFNTSNVRFMDEMFRGSEQLEELDLSSFDTRNVETVERMFSGCVKLRHLDLSGFDLSKITAFFRVFEGCTGLVTLDLPNITLPEDADTFGAFSGCDKLVTVFCRDSDTDFGTNDGAATFYCQKLKGRYGETTVPYKDFENGDRHLCSAKLGGYFTP